MKPKVRVSGVALWAVALAALLVLTWGAWRDWDAGDLVFWGVIALWYQQMALSRG